MESLWLLLPLSVLVVLALIGLIAWSIGAGQFEDLEREGVRIFEPERAVHGTAPALDARQRPAAHRAEESFQPPRGGAGRTGARALSRAATTNPERS